MEPQIQRKLPKPPKVSQMPAKWSKRVEKRRAKKESRKIRKNGCQKITGRARASGMRVANLSLMSPLISLICLYILISHWFNTAGAPRRGAPYSKRERAFRQALGKVYRWVASFCRFLLRRSTTSTKTEQKWDPNRPQMGPIWARGGEGATEN